MYRFPGSDKRSSNQAGWCKLFPDGLAGVFGDWSSGLSEKWRSDKPGERINHAAILLAQMRRHAEEKEKHAKAAQRASAMWARSRPANPDHPYLVRKGIKPFSARQIDGELLLPVIAISGQVVSTQTIYGDGRKMLMAGGQKKGCLIPVSEVPHHEKSSQIIICEGFATGCTLANDQPGSYVVAAIDAGNLLPVATAIRGRHPDAEIVIAGDDDRLTQGNPGATKARAAVIAVNGLLALPCWPAGTPETLTDFNDLDAWLIQTRGTLDE